MGMDFSAGKFHNLCKDCNRVDYTTIYEVNKKMFKEMPDDQAMRKEQGIYVYSGASKLFARHIKNGKTYRGQKAIKKWQAVKKCIVMDIYKEVRVLLKDGDGWFYACW